MRKNSVKIAIFYFLINIFTYLFFIISIFI